MRLSMSKWPHNWVRYVGGITVLTRGIMPRLAPLVVAAWMLAGVALFGLAACNDSASAMESWPLDRSDSLLGPDLDGDGIRDDIRSIIDLHYPPAHRAQLYQS